MPPPSPALPCSPKFMKFGGWGFSDPLIPNPAPALRDSAWVIRDWHRGDAAMLPHCSLHSSTTPGRIGMIPGAFERSRVLLSERLGARSRKHHGKEEK
ncbi:hypothetical protein SCHPADRAFT_653300 [Schizopora paradoxa]|uniref:Uncharacterized protein n=1 Tax=Schizopora paradoxa TaxID=27342 RepID=A0A0H2R662_9AGAM|nr:hypothetical protein SCHPADRAFT_653300 [Schizopora paradoxa]